MSRIVIRSIVGLIVAATALHAILNPPTPENQVLKPWARVAICSVTFIIGVMMLVRARKARLSS